MRSVWRVSALIVLLAVGCPAPVPGPVATAAPVPKSLKRSLITCALQGSPKCEVGKVPKMTVTLTNRTGGDIYLVGGLDASSWRGRYPHCYFEVTGPDGKPVTPLLGGCGNMNTLRVEDFVRVPSGESFDPFDPYRRGSGYEIFNPLIAAHMFKALGEYRFRFVYSTACDNLMEWAGDGAEKVVADEVIAARFRQVPRVEASSEEFTLTVTAAGKK